MKNTIKFFVIVLILFSIFLFYQKFYRLDVLIKLNSKPSVEFIKLFKESFEIDNYNRVSGYGSRVEFQYEYKKSENIFHFRFVSKDLNALNNIKSQFYDKPQVLVLESYRGDICNEFTFTCKINNIILNKINNYSADAKNFNSWHIQSAEVTDQSPSILSISFTVSAILVLIFLLIS